MDNSQENHLSRADKKSILIEKELKFVRALAGNNAKLRRKVLKNLKTWLATRSRSTFAFTDTDFLRLWKGLFYCMWLADKPLVQEALADDIASLVKCFDNIIISLKYFGAFLETMCLEWFGIDHWRMDKFMMLVRRCTRQTLILLHESDWPVEHVNIFMQQIEKTVLNADKCPFGLTKHFDDLLLEEVAKVSKGDVTDEAMQAIVKPYAIRLLQTNDRRMIKHITSSIFHYLIYQSELGQAYQEKFELWKNTNFVTGNIDDVDYEVQYEYEENDKDYNTEEKEMVYDPRAGQVDVIINAIRFNAMKIIEIFECNRYKSFVTSKGKKQMKMLVKQLKKFASGIFPLGFQSVASITEKDYAVDIDEQIKELENYEKKTANKETNSKNCQKLTQETHDKFCADRKKISSSNNVTNGKTKKKLTKKQLKEKMLMRLKEKREEKLKNIKEAKASKQKNSHSVSTKNAIQKSTLIFTSAAGSSKKPSKTKKAFNDTDDWPGISQNSEKLPSTLFCEVKHKKLAKAQVSEFGDLLVTPISKVKCLKRAALSTDETTKVKKRVKIALNRNVSQDLQQHIAQVERSPQVPYDSARKPVKGALKPNLLPSPINPFYRKKIGLKLNDTL
ncbi:ribosomal RNA processing protein 1 homolog [Sabethes cyaneus]|uniref:ribosomal RNA processing protein 1 homolog n=1 Tax=Sabethes cyaneus TaxID=53552 RepID=UPI00237E95DF|nr:ribosomal RNA processing protein 1 homolog [Sabethes cyaneus]